MEPIIVRGGGDIATGTIYELCRAGYPVIILEIERPSAIRRNVAFCQAVYDGSIEIEGMTCSLCDTFEAAWKRAMAGEPAMVIDPFARMLDSYHPWFLIDAILAKHNTGTERNMADITVGLGPGFTAGIDVDFVIETKRGHTLGRIIDKGSAIPDTGIPGIVGGYGKERVIHSPAEGTLVSIHQIADIVHKDEPIAFIRSQEGDVPVPASLDGIMRGLIQDGFPVTKGLKIADIDPRLSELNNCYTISDKARCIAGSALLLAVMAERGRLRLNR